MAMVTDGINVAARVRRYAMWHKNTGDQKAVSLLDGVEVVAGRLEDLARYLDDPDAVEEVCILAGYLRSFCKK